MPVTDFTTVDHSLNYETARTMADNFRTLAAANALLTVPEKLPVSEIFNAAQVIALLSQTDAVGLRITPAVDENDEIVFLLTAVLEDGSEILTQDYTDQAEANDGRILLNLEPLPITADKTFVKQHGTKVPPFPDNGFISL